MRWPPWRRYESHDTTTVDLAQAEAQAKIRQAKAQAPKVLAAERATRALKMQTERLADEVDQVMRLRGMT